MSHLAKSIIIAGSLALCAPATAEPMRVAALITASAEAQGVPAPLAVAVGRVESGLRCYARGRAGELGPLQIKPATARGLGFSGPASALNSCGAGIHWGVRHLAVAYRRCGTAHGAATLHNRGLGARCTASAYSGKVARAMGQRIRVTTAPVPERHPNAYFQQWWLSR